MANPYHDPRTGKFASASGLNRANSTLGQRGKARVKEHISDAKAYALGAAGIALGGIGAALLQGVTKPIRIHATHVANAAIKAGIQKASGVAATHSPTIGKALRSGTTTLMSHVKNMKAAGAVQHAPKTNTSVAPQKSNVSIDSLSSHYARLNKPAPRSSSSKRRK